jgi:hypothetical protein
MVENMNKFMDNSHMGPSFDMKGNMIRGDSGASNIQMEQIGNVFYNLLGMLGQQTGDIKLIGVSQQLRE